jgi:hypothetical protein
MGLTASPRELHDRLARARAVATAARERAGRAVSAAVGVHARASRVQPSSINASTGPFAHARVASRRSEGAVASEEPEAHASSQPSEADTGPTTL